MLLTKRRYLNDSRHEVEVSIVLYNDCFTLQTGTNDKNSHDDGSQEWWPVHDVPTISKTC